MIFEWKQTKEKLGMNVWMNFCIDLIWEIWVNVVFGIIVKFCYGWFKNKTAFGIDYR